MSGINPSNYEGGNLGGAAYVNAAVGGFNQSVSPTGGISANPSNYCGGLTGGNRRRRRRSNKGRKSVKGGMLKKGGKSRKSMKSRRNRKSKGKR